MTNIKEEVYKAQQWGKWKFHKEYERPYIREFAEKHNYTPYQAVSRLVTIDDELKFIRGDKEVIKAYCYRENINPKTAAEHGVGQ